MSDMAPRNAKAERAGAKAYAKASRPWYKKKRWWAAGLLLIIIIAVAGGGAGSDDSDPTASETASQGSQEDEPAAEEEPTAEEEPAMTAPQENAVEAAESYLGFSSFSKNGLIQQLSSKAGDGYTRAQAVYAVNKVGL